MTKQRFEVVQDSETGRVELIENGVAFMGAPARINLREHLMLTLADQTPVLSEPAGLTWEGAASLVEEIINTTYNQSKARFGTTLEALLGIAKLTGTPVGRLFEYTLDDLMRVIGDLVRDRAPEVMAVMAERAGSARMSGAHRSGDGRKRIKLLLNGQTLAGYTTVEKDGVLTVIVDGETKAQGAM